MKTQLLKENDGFPERQQVVEGFDTPGYESFPQITEPRFIKTHFPFSLLPPSVMDNEAKVSVDGGINCLNIMKTYEFILR